MRTLVVVSNDYWGVRAGDVCVGFKDVTVAVDRSSSIKRIAKLILRRSIPLQAGLAMWRSMREWPRLAPRTPYSVTGNADLRELRGSLLAKRIVLFRAGLIISDRTLEECETLNIHCADIVEFGGLASIYRALKARRYEQHATLHRVTNRIDSGDVLDTESFRLDPALAYQANESLAYEAGLRLLGRALA